MPQYSFRQKDVMELMQRIYGLDERESRKLAFMYRQSDIETRYTVIDDYTENGNRGNLIFSGDEVAANLDERMKIYNREALPLSVNAINDCLKDKIHAEDITHLITVSCTGMSAPGLDLQIAESLNMKPEVFRTSVNFMGCYGAVHALKLSDAICHQDTEAKVLVVCTELCTLHFQREATMDNIASSLLFGDGSAAALITNDRNTKGIHLSNFYSEVLPKGKKDMAWELSSTGFSMTLSNYIPDLIEEDFAILVNKALTKANLLQNDISYWCIHPGGKKILEAIHKSLHFDNGHLDKSYEVLEQYGNMSSPSILFVLRKMMDSMDYQIPNNIFGAAFGPGLTMETFVGTTLKD